MTGRQSRRGGVRGHSPGLWRAPGHPGPRGRDCPDPLASEACPAPWWLRCCWVAPGCLGHGGVCSPEGTASAPSEGLGTWGAVVGLGAREAGGLGSAARIPPQGIHSQGQTGGGPGLGPLPLLPLSPPDPEARPQPQRPRVACPRLPFRRHVAVEPWEPLLSRRGPRGRRPVAAGLSVPVLHPHVRPPIGPLAGPPPAQWPGLDPGREGALLPVSLLSCKNLGHQRGLFP